MKYHLLPSILIAFILSSAVSAQQASKAPAADAQKPSEIAESKPETEQPRTLPPKVDRNRMQLLANKTETDSQLWLQQGQQKFLSIYHPNNQHPGKGALLILHDDGQHPRWPDTIETISATMPDYGWATISISLPDLQPAVRPGTKTSNTTEDQAVGRIMAALDYLSTQGLLNVILVGSGTGAPRGASLLQSLPTPEPTPQGTTAARAIAALVIINDNNPSELATLSPGFNDAAMPILDVYFGNQETTIIAAKRRKQMANRQKMATYRQIRLSELNGMLSLGENRLSKRIRGFIERHAKGVAKPLRVM